ncbi:hypothetical protein [Granulicella sp. L46]|uniref:hypothetical protein n=1 Tax=Granulicella sp. L46 TaxID=1641865 RepID=UPI00131C1325|nr:hypothetical protein [Granulicella sp. L46]
MKTLRELAASRNERIRLQAALRMSEILLHFEQSQERIAIAGERAAARKAEAIEKPGQGAHPHEPARARESAEEAAERFLGLMRKGSNDQ